MKFKTYTIKQALLLMNGVNQKKYMRNLRLVLKNYVKNIILQTKYMMKVIYMINMAMKKL